MRSINTLTLILALGLTACPADDKGDTDTGVTSTATATAAMTTSGTTAEPLTTTGTPTTTDATDSGATDSGTTAEPGTTGGTTAEPGTTGGSTGGATDESPYNACASNMDCGMGSFCINAALTMDMVKGSFCSPACQMDKCPDPADGVNAQGGAQCLFGTDPMMPSNCAIVCEVGKDDCGPSSDCEDIGIPPQMGKTLGVCTHPA